MDEYHAEVLPEDKAQFAEAEYAAGHTVIMVGDVINDSLPSPPLMWASPSEMGPLSTVKSLTSLEVSLRSVKNLLSDDFADQYGK